MTSSSDKIPPSAMLRNFSTPPLEREKRSLRESAIGTLDRMDIAIRVFAVTSVLLLITTIVLIALAQAEYVTPIAALYAFSGCVASFIVIKAIDCCQNSVAKKNNIDLQEYYDIKQPPIPRVSK